MEFVAKLLLVVLAAVGLAECVGLLGDLIDRRRKLPLYLIAPLPARPGDCENALRSLRRTVERSTFACKLVLTSPGELTEEQREILGFFYGSEDFPEVWETFDPRRNSFLP